MKKAVMPKTTKAQLPYKPPSLNMLAAQRSVMSINSPKSIKGHETLTNSIRGHGHASPTNFNKDRHSGLSSPSRVSFNQTGFSINSPRRSTIPGKQKKPGFI